MRARVPSFRSHNHKSNFSLESGKRQKKCQSFLLRDLRSEHTETSDALYFRSVLLGSSVRVHALENNSSIPLLNTLNGTGSHTVLIVPLRIVLNVEYLGFLHQQSLSMLAKH